MQFQQQLTQAGQVTTLFTGTVSGAGAGNFNVNVPPGIRTLIIVQSGQTVQTGMHVFVSSPLITYYNQITYLQLMTVVPLFGLTPQSVSVNISGAGANSTITVYGDSAIYPESTFYNGTMQVASNSSNGAAVAILRGPARILSIELDILNTTGAGIISLNGTGFMRVDNASASGFNGAVSMNFPPNSIILNTDQFTISSTSTGFVSGFIAWAYP